MPERKLRARAYLLTSVLSGIIITLWAPAHVPWTDWLNLSLFAAASAGLSAFPVQVRNKHHFSMASALILAGMTIWGPATAVLLAALHGLVATIVPKRQTADKIAFNAASQALAAGVAGAVHGLPAYLPGGNELIRLTAEFAGAPLAYSLTNTLMVGTVVALHSGIPLWQLLKSNLWVAPYWATLWAAAAAIYLIHLHIGFFGVLVFLAPILLARYSFKLYVEKTKEAEAYVEQLETSNHRLEVKIRHLSALHDGAVLLTAGLKSDEVRDRIRHVAVDLLGLSDGFLLEHRADGLYCTARWAGGQPLAGEALPEHLETAAAAVAAQGVPGTADDYTLLPLAVSGSSTAVLGLLSPSPQQELDSVLQTFSAQVAVVLANSALFQQTLRMATTDDLTGLANQRGMREVLDRSLAAAIATGESLSLITLDMDNFKQINDRCGHPAGDAALRHLAGLITRHAGPAAVAARNGGDEFAIILPRCTARAAEATARAILDELRSQPLVYEGTSLELEASAGVATYPDHAASGPVLISRADQSTYISKHTGPNRITVWGQFPGVEAQSGPPWSGSDRRASGSEWRAKVDTLRVISGMVDAKVGLTYGHSVRVQRFAASLALAVGLADNTVEVVRIGGLLHDLGKIGVPEQILAKPGALTAQERLLINRHPEIGADLMRRLGLPEELVSLIYFHHEFYDGRGYPTGASGREIPLGARIVSICDAFEAMTSDRPYRRAIQPGEALAELRRCAGSQFDPDLVEIFVRRVVPQAVDNEIESTHRGGTEPCDVA